MKLDDYFTFTVFTSQSLFLIVSNDMDTTYIILTVWVLDFDHRIRCKHHMKDYSNIWYVWQETIVLFVLYVLCCTVSKT